MKKFFAVLAMFAMLLAGAGCSSDSESVIGGADGPTNIIVKDKNNGLTEYKSPLGFSVKYDADAFERKSENGSELFTYNEKTAVPIYVSVQLIEDMDAKTVADGLALQSGTDDYLLRNTRFGANSIDAVGVYYTKENKGTEEIFSFYAVDTDSGTLLLEAHGFVGQSERADSKLEEFLAGFSLN